MFFLDIAGVVFPDTAVVFLACCCSSLRMLPSFSPVSAVFVSCFCTKLLGICTKLKNFCIKSVRLLGMLFSDLAVVFRTLLLFSLDATVVFSGHCCYFLRMLLPFPSVSAVSLGFCRFCFMLLYKNFWNLYKTQYFLYKNRRKFQHVFSVFSGYILSGPRTFLLFPLSIANRKSCF